MRNRLSDARYSTCDGTDVELGRRQAHEAVARAERITGWTARRSPDCGLVVQISLMRFARADSVPRINADGPLAALSTWAVKHPSATETR